WKNLDQALDGDFQLAMHGGLMVAETPQQSALLERKSQIEQSQGLAVDLLDGDQARKLAPYLADSVLAALYCADEGHCNPRLLTPAFARKAASAGAKLLTHTAVSGIERLTPGWRITCSRTHSSNDAGLGQARQIRCDRLLNAAGAGAPTVAAMAQLHLPLFAVGLTMNATEKCEPVIGHLIQHVGRKLSLKQTEDGNLLVGGGWGARLRQQQGRWSAHESPELSLDSVLGNLRTAAEVVPLVKSLRLIRTWTGTTCITADQLPVLGEFAQAPGFFVAAGGSGFTYGPTYARLMSELMLSGQPSYPLAPFSPDRFGGLNAFMA
ncbi:MAG TPA: FAD-dependent oxidoreductase, partial [Xanthomonadales bacterium]|nr:FAD-dependent oxidoreductase [Xanthomonadales bacterium]